jgi:hypothetical protein
MRAHLACGTVIVVLLGAFGTFVGAQDGRELPKGFTRVTLPPGKLPEGVVHVRLPPGEFSVEDIERDGKVILRITASKTVIETKSFFIGDGNGAALVQAPTQRLRNKQTNGPGSSLYYEDFVPVDKLKPGSLYITTPSVNVGWFTTAQPRKQKQPPSVDKKDKTEKEKRQ